MPNYNVTTKVFRNDVDGEAHELLEAYLNSLDDTKTIRGIAVSPAGGDNLVILLVHDA